MSAEPSAQPPTSDAPVPSASASPQPTQQPSQQPTTEPPAQSSAQPTTQSPQPTTQPQASSQQPTQQPSSQQPQPSSQQPEPSSASPSPPAQSSALPTSQQQQQSQSQAQQSQAPSSQAGASSAPGTSVPPTTTPPTSNRGSAAPSPSASILESDATSAILVTTTDASGNTVTSAPPTITRLSTSTGANGEAITLTQVIRNPGFNNGSSSPSSGSSAFFNNTGAVAGTFVAVGLVCTLGVIGVIAFLLKRRRRQRLDRDVTAAAAAASAASHHHHQRAAFDDDDADISPPMTQYGGYFAGAGAASSAGLGATPGLDVNGQPQPQGPYHDYEDPAGGYDHYATQLQPLPPAAHSANAGDRFSTATAPGLAGFGAQSAQMNYDYGNGNGNGNSNNGYEYPPGHGSGGQEHLVGGGAQDARRQSQGYYYDAPNVGGGNAAYNYSDEHEDPYGGYSDNVPQHHQNGAGAGRRGSDGSLPGQGHGRGQSQEGGLKITNV